jgi:tryptophan synthase alpha chain
MSQTRIARLFERTRAERRAAFIAYLTAGDPTPDRTPALVEAMERGGADLIELGVPFSDPLADGPVIQRAAMRALEAGTTLARVIEIARRIRTRSEIPLLLFTYLNPVLRYGVERLAADAKQAGIDGCLLTDLSVEEAEDLVAIMRAHTLDTVFLAAPTSTARRLELVARYSSGFAYLVSRTGVTGERNSLSSSAAPLVASMRGVTDLPLAVGFGISTPDQVEAVAQLADGVVVGSAFVRVIEQCAGGPSLETDLESATRELRRAIRAKSA